MKINDNLILWIINCKLIASTSLCKVFRLVQNYKGNLLFKSFGSNFSIRSIQLKKAVLFILVFKYKCTVSITLKTINTD